MLKDMMKEKGLTKRQMSRTTGIPYTTICDLISGAVPLTKTSALNLFKIAKFFNVSMEALLEKEIPERKDFEWFKSNERHRLKEMGDFEYIIEAVKEDYIVKCWEKKWYLEALYLLGMLDYLCRINGIPVFKRYDSIRGSKMNHVVYPIDIILSDRLSKCSGDKKKSIELSIPEFIRHNIVEVEVRDIA